MGRLCVKKLDETATFWGRRRGIGESFTLYVLRFITVTPQQLISKGHVVEGGSRLSDARGERLSGSVMERSLTATPRSGVRSETERILIF